MVHIIQCLCPHRHCILAIAYDPATFPCDQAMTGFKELVRELIAAGTINPWCGLCDSRAWDYEDRVTRFQTVEEAKPELERCEAAQASTRRMFEEQKNSRN